MGPNRRRRPIRRKIEKEQANKHIIAAAEHRRTTEPQRQTRNERKSHRKNQVTVHHFPGSCRPLPTSAARTISYSFLSHSPSSSTSSLFSFHIPFLSSPSPTFAPRCCRHFLSLHHLLRGLLLLLLLALTQPKERKLRRHCSVFT